MGNSPRCWRRRARSSTRRASATRGCTSPSIFPPKRATSAVQAASPAGAAPDTVLVNGRIVTVDDHFSIAQALASNRIEW